MNTSSLVAASVIAIAATVSYASYASARAHDEGASNHSHPVAHPTEGASQNGADRLEVVELAVTSDGFVPSTVTVKRGKLVKLVVTRKTEKTCATDIVMKDFGVNQPLPLDQPVSVVVKPAKAGQYRYTCAMGMIRGTLRVE